MILNQILRKEDNGIALTQAEEDFLEFGIVGRPAPVTTSATFTDIESGLGIGGIGSDDYNIHTESYPSHYQYKCGRGQRYDERCESCRRVTTVCNDCGRCARCHEKQGG